VTEEQISMVEQNYADRRNKDGWVQVGRGGLGLVFLLLSMSNIMNAVLLGKSML
jgi:hypothetical protein